MGYISRSAGTWDGGVVASNVALRRSSERSHAVSSDIEGTTVFICVILVCLSMGD